MKKIIPYGRQHIDKTDISHVISALSRDKLTTGELTLKFEKKIKEYLKTNYVLTTSSGTSAIDLAFRILEIKKGDVVLMPAINFIAAFNTASLQKAKIYLVDVDKITGQMTPEIVSAFIKKKKIKKIKCLVTMYLGGSPENIEKFYQLKKKYNFFILEDACHAFGSSFVFKNRVHKVGSNINSDICTFSFHPVKTIATGEGGCITTKNKEFYQKGVILKNHGIKRTKFHWDYDVKQNSHNYRLSDVNCSLGISQLKKIDKFLKTRNKIANFYNKNLDNCEPYIKLPKYNVKNYNSFHLYIISLNFNLIKKNKNHFFKYMLKKRITFQYHYKPIYKFSLLRSSKKLMNSEYYFKNAISIPIYYNLNNLNQKKIVKEIKNYIEKFKIKKKILEK